MDPELFHPGRGEDTTVPQGGLPAVHGPRGCLDEAIARNEKFGVWGGTSERERRRLRRQRRAA